MIGGAFGGLWVGPGVGPWAWQYAKAIYDVFNIPNITQLWNIILKTQWDGLILRIQWRAKVITSHAVKISQNLLEQDEAFSTPSIWQSTDMAKAQTYWDILRPTETRSALILPLTELQLEWKTYH